MFRERHARRWAKSELITPAFSHRRRGRRHSTLAIGSCEVYHLMGVKPPPKMTSWEDYLPPHKPFYRRAWFLTLVLLFFAGIGGSALFVWWEMEKWDRQAQSFDYSKLNGVCERHFRPE
jgi:hypothetical protein